MWARFARKRSGRIEHVRRRFGRLRTKRKEERAYYSAAVGLGIGILNSIVLISRSFWLLGRRRAREETAPTTPAPEKGVEASPPEGEEVVMLEEDVEVVSAGPPSAEEVPPREEPPPG